MILTAFFVINGIYHISRLSYFDIAHKVRHAHVIYTGIPFDWRGRELVSHVTCYARPEAGWDNRSKFRHWYALGEKEDGDVQRKHST